MKKYLALTLALLALAAVIGIRSITGPSANALAVDNQNCQDKLCSEMSVTGTGRIKLQPDFASINLNVETSSKNLDEAQSSNASLVQDLMEVFKEHSIDKSDITTNGYYINPEFNYFNQGFVKHKVSNQLKVKVRDIENVGKIIDAAVAAGANTVSGIQFGVEDSAAAYNQALAGAVEVAKQKAVVLSKASGFDDIKIVSIKEVSNNYWGFERFSMANSVGAASTQIMHSEIEVSATVELVFEVC